MEVKDVIITQDFVDAVEAQIDIPYGVLDGDITSSAKSAFFNELNEIKAYYLVYAHGATFPTEGSNSDYIPSQVRCKKAKSLIDKEARFMFSKAMDIAVNQNAVGDTQAEQTNSTILNDFVQAVLKKNFFNRNLTRAGKDCFIGKRVACVLNFSPDTGIEVAFVGPTEFYYEFDGNDVLSKLIVFFTAVESTNKAEQRIRKKVYWMEDNVCHVSETMYDGAGLELEVLSQDIKTLFNYIPAVIIFNDGLSNDIHGESEIAAVMEYEQTYSKLANADIDSERKGMNCIRYIIDGSPESTANLSSAPGALWDIQSDQNGASDKTATIGTLEPSMSYSAPLKTTLDRIDNIMHAQLEIPNINSEQLQGVITSGKTLKALYWGLIVRCDEKALTWGPAIEFVVRTIIEGAKLYPEVVQYYSNSNIPDTEYEVTVTNNYALPEDEAEEKTLNLAEVQAQTMSRKYYMKYWRKLTDDQADAELEQIAKERSLLEDSFMMPPTDVEKEEEGNEGVPDAQTDSQPKEPTTPDTQDTEEGVDSAASGA